MQLSAESNFPDSTVSVLVQDVSDNKEPPSGRSVKPQPMLSYSHSWGLLRKGQDVAETESVVFAGRQINWRGRDGDSIGSKHMGVGWRGTFIDYSVSASDYFCDRVPYVGYENSAFNFAVIRKWNIWYAIHQFAERNLADSQSRAVRSNKFPVSEIDRLSREAGLVASSAPEGVSKDGDENRRDSGDRPIVNVKEGSDSGSDPEQVAETRHLVSGIIFIIGSVIAVIWLGWRAWWDRF